MKKISLTLLIFSLWALINFGFFRRKMLPSLFRVAHFPLDKVLHQQDKISFLYTHIYKLNFYRGAIEGIRTGNITIWHGMGDKSCPEDHWYLSTCSPCCCLAKDTVCAIIPPDCRAAFSPRLWDNPQHYTCKLVYFCIILYFLYISFACSIKGTTNYISFYNPVVIWQEMYLVKCHGDKTLANKIIFSVKCS